MIRKLFLFSFMIFAWTFNYAQPPEYLWTKTIQGSTGENISALCTDSRGFMYAAGGYYNGSADLDPGNNVLLVIAPPSQFISYICKFDPSGSLVWAKWLEGSAYFSSLCVDNAGNVYSSGTFQGQVDFDPSPATYSLTSAMSGNSESSFVWKLSSSGQFMNAGAFGGGTLSAVESTFLKFDGQQNLYCTGGYKGVADIDPGPGVTSLTLTSSNAFLVKLDLSLNLTSYAVFRSPGYSRIDDLENDNAGNATVELFISSTGTVDLDPGAAVYAFNCNGLGNKVIVKVSPAMNLISTIHGASATSWGGSVLEKNLEIDKNNEVFLRVSATGTVVLSPSSGATTINAGSNYGLYILHFTSTGGFVNYDTLVNGGPAFELENDTLVFGGEFTGTLDFDPSPSSATATSSGASDAFIYALDKSFQLQWLRTFGGPARDYIFNLAYSVSGELYASGGFSTTCDFDPATSSNTITSLGGLDPFISKFSPCADIPYNNSDYTICAGNAASLVVVSSSSVNWYQNSTGGTALSTGSVYSTPVLTAGTHTFFVSSAGCSLMARTEVVVFAEPGPSVTIVSPSGSICLGNSATLTASGASSFQWSGGPSSPKYVIAPTQNTVYTVTGTHTLNTCVTTKSTTVLVSGCVGLPKNSQEQWQIFPNPSSGVFNISGFANPGTAQVLDLTGKIVLRFKCGKDTTTIDLSGLDAGVYFLRINSDGLDRTEKLVIRK
jgi:hypothetical protein